MPVSINGNTGVVTGLAALPDSAMSSGSIIQVVQTVKTDAFTTTSTSFVDITGLSVDITPSSSSNKILVTATIDAYAQRTSSYNSMSLVRLLRDSTALIGGHMRGRIDNSDTANYFNSGGHVSVKYLDTPSTTSQLTYKIQGVNWAADSTLYINTETGNTYYSKSTIIAQEVVA
tara:strand:- start:6 stop:527 length:522 start_codon:yes stop_codon:yes gene_type:complete